MPIAVTIATDEIADAFKKLTISTFGGNPVCAATANATLELIENEHLPDNSERMGMRLREGLEDLKRRFPGPIGDVRGKGLMQGVEMVVDETQGDRTPNPQAVVQLFEETKKRGLLIGKGGLHGNVLRISPPLVVGKAEIADALKILADSLGAMGA